MNQSNGYPIDNSSTNCYFDLYNSSGVHLIETIVPHENSIKVNEWELKVLGGNFSTIGQYGYIIQCNSSASSLGGVEEVGFEVTFTGRDINPSLIALYFLLFLSLIGGMFLFNRNKKEKMEIKSDWNLFKLFSESIKEFRFFLNWIFITLILFFLSNFFFVFGFNMLHTISVGVFYFSLICGIPVVIIFALQFLDVRKRCEELGDLVSWGKNE